MKTSWIATVGKDGRILLPKELVERLGWKDEDVLNLKFTARKDGTWQILLSKVEKK